MDGETSLARVSEKGESHSPVHPPAENSSMPADAKPADALSRVWKVVATREGLFIGLVFLLAFIVRAHLMRFELFFEFDSYWHARMVSYLLQGLPAPMVDPLAYYQNVSAASIGNPPLFFWYVSAALYKIFTLNGAYDFETLVLFVKILPAFYGALTSAAMYFLGKELFKGPHEKAAGLFAGIFAAVVPSFVYRTMGGFFEDDSFGFLWMVIGFVFLVRATRNPEFSRQKIMDAVLAGLGFGLMVVSWPGYNQLIPVLLGLGFVQFLAWVKEGELEAAKGYALYWGISFLILAAFATVITGTGWLSQFGTIVGTLLLGAELFWYHTLGLMLLLFGVAALVWKMKKGGSLVQGAWISRFYGVVILALVLAPLLVTVFDVSLRTGGVLSQTVGEESDGGNYFGNKYSMLIVFALIGIPAMGYLLIRKSRHYEFLALPLVWGVVVFFMAWGKLKFTYYWGLPLALMGAVVFVLGIKWMEHRSIGTQKFAVMGMGFMILCAMGAGILFVSQNTPNIEATPGWKTALFWADEKLPLDAKFFNWWDEGHWISFLANRKVLIDNRNTDTKTTSDVARFLLSTDANEAGDLVSKYGSTHLIFGEDLLEKLSNLGFYAYNITTVNDPRIRDIFGAVMNCSQEQVPLTKEVTYRCANNTLTPAQLASYPTAWVSTPNTLQNGTPFFIYREEDNSKIYAFTSAANRTTLVRLWMQDSQLWSRFGEMYRNNQGVRIYEVVR